MNHIIHGFAFAAILGITGSVAQAEVVTVEGTIKAVDAKKRTITVEADGEEQILDVSRKAKVNVKGTTAKLDSLKPGQKVKLSYHDDLEIVLKIEVMETGRPSAFGGDVVGVHDPCVIKDGNTFVMFSTGGLLPMRRSHDLMLWKEAGDTLPTLPAWAKRMVPKASDCWAPDISYFDDEYHLYYSVSSFGSNHSCIGLATNSTLDPDSSDYNWTDQGMVVRSRSGQDKFNAIDPNVVLDENGKPWLSFGSFWSGIKLVQLDVRTGKPSGRPIDIAGRNGGAIEAPFVVRRRRWYYLFVSFDMCCKGKDSNYKVMVGRSRKVTGPYTDFWGKRMTEGGGTLVLAGYDNVRGPGHNAVISEGGKDFFMHHHYDANFNGRVTLQIRPLIWGKDGWPLVGEPLEKVPGDQSIQRDQVVGSWKHSADFGRTATIRLEQNGSIDGGAPSWKLGTKNRLTLRWPRSNAPNGVWVDHCFVSADAMWYVGRNQNGGVIRGLKLQ